VAIFVDIDLLEDLLDLLVVYFSVFVTERLAKNILCLRESQFLVMADFEILPEPVDGLFDQGVSQVVFVVVVGVHRDEVSLVRNLLLLY
jgi:hypothetical protein